ncbi:MULTISPECIES: hypothetical protein [Bacillus]|uniref:hypothetical protein n=1 Tax=Bacillus TaxID=1386 RepID=UPI0015C4B909|nr:MULTISPECIES: hypothetical protein [Bacillus]
MILKATLKLELDDLQKKWVSYVREQGGEEAVFHYLEEEVQKKLNWLILWRWNTKKRVINSVRNRI